MDNEIYEIDEQEELEPITPPRFVVNTVLNSDVQAEAAQTAQSKGIQIFGYVCMGLCAAMFIALIVMYFIHKTPANLFYAALMLLVLGYMLYNKYVSPKKQRERWESTIKRAFGTKELHLVTEFYELSLMQSMQEDEENLVDAGYSELVEMKESENLFLIRCRNRQWFFLSKHGFTVGSAESFRLFITERMGGN